jgi:hypothetical protein
MGKPTGPHRPALTFLTRVACMNVWPCKPASATCFPRDPVTGSRAVLLVCRCVVPQMLAVLSGGRVASGLTDGTLQVRLSYRNSWSFTRLCVMT